MATFDVAVIGLGAMGSAALFNLAHQGRRVIGIEQFEPGHDKGSSHGESRIIRLSYFEHPSYVPLARRALEKWRELEQLSGKTHSDGDRHARSGLSQGVQWSRARSRPRGSTSLNTRFSAPPRSTGASPPSAFRPNWTGLYQPDAGFLRPELAIQQFVALAERTRCRSPDSDTRSRHRAAPVRGFACAQMTA